jgi:hypothetical protein
MIDYSLIEIEEPLENHFSDGAVDPAGFENPVTTPSDDTNKDRKLRTCRRDAIVHGLSLDVVNVDIRKHVDDEVVFFSH